MEPAEQILNHDKIESPLINVEELEVEFIVGADRLKILEGINFSIERGEIMALVGETGCGKSVTAKSLIGLISPKICQRKGSICFDGLDLMRLSHKEMQDIRGNRIAMIFQNPIASLNPVFTLGEQIFRLIKMYLAADIERMQVEKGLTRKKAIEKIAAGKLKEVGLTDKKWILKSYPHQNSGGMAQRFRIAMALIGAPQLLIADEATSALDVTVQAHILSLLTTISRNKQTAILLITHDLGIAAQICDRIAVMYAGRIVEIASANELFKNPLHPYTHGLLSAVPKIGQQHKIEQIPGIIPDLRNPPSGCRFHPRCSKFMEICRTQKPVDCFLGHRRVACHLYSSKMPSVSIPKIRNRCANG